MTTQNMTQEEISLRDQMLAYARELQASEANITLERVREKLNARFVKQLEIDPSYSYGAINNPSDWFEGLSKIFSALAKLFGKKQPKPIDHAEAISGIVDGIIVVLRENKK